MIERQNNRILLLDQRLKEDAKRKEAARKSLQETEKEMERNYLAKKQRILDEKKKVLDEQRDALMVHAKSFSGTFTCFIVCPSSVQTPLSRVKNSTHQQSVASIELPGRLSPCSKPLVFGRN